MMTSWTAVLLLASVQAGAQWKPSHYEALGVPRDADAASIKQAFRKVALRDHPDKLADGASPNVRKEAERRFEEANEAYHVLSDPAQRRRYDLSQAAAGPGSAAARSGEPAAEILIVCTLAELGGFAAVPLHAALAAGGLPIALAMQSGVPSRVVLPPGSRAGDVIRIPLRQGAELDLRLREMRHRRFERLVDDTLRASVWLPAWHNWRKPAVRMRTICGKRIVLRPRGERCTHGELVRAEAFGMPRQGGLQRADMLVRLQIRSVPASLLRVAATAGGAGAAMTLTFLVLCDDDADETPNGLVSGLRRLAQRSITTMAPAFGFVLGQGLRMAFG